VATLLRQLVAGFFLLNPIQVRVEFLVDTVAPDRIWFGHLCFVLFVSLHRRYMAI